MYVLWLDDYRVPHGDFLNVAQDLSAELVIVKNYDEFVRTIQARGCPTLISFDHDLADEHYAGDFSREKTGMDCARWFGEWLLDDPTHLPNNFGFTVHSMNPVGAENIRSYLIQALEHVRGAVGNTRPDEA